MLRPRLKILRLGVALASAALLLTGSAPAFEPGRLLPEGERIKARWLMGTVLEVRFPAAREDADELAEVAFREISKVEEAASLWRPGTELQAVHARAAAGEAVVLSETLGALVEEALGAAKLTDGAFSPAVGALVLAYDLRGEGRWPSAAERRRAAELARPDGVRYDRETRRLRLAAGVTLDLDGIAKGFALDRAAGALRARGVDDALLNFGGQLLSIGPPPGSPPRETFVAAPGAAGEALLSVPLRDGSVSTSSDSERLRAVAGAQAGHLIDPRSGDFVRFRGSVSVLASSGALADALSTAWAVQGVTGYRRTPDGAPFRKAGAVAFVSRRRDGGFETLSDRPFHRLRPPAEPSVAVVADP